MKGALRPNVLSGPHSFHLPLHSFSLSHTHHFLSLSFLTPLTHLSCYLFYSFSLLLFLSPSLVLCTYHISLTCSLLKIILSPAPLCLSLLLYHTCLVSRLLMIAPFTRPLTRSLSHSFTLLLLQFFLTHSLSLYTSSPPQGSDLPLPHFFPPSHSLSVPLMRCLSDSRGLPLSLCQPMSLNECWPLRPPSSTQKKWAAESQTAM